MSAGILIDGLDPGAHNHDGSSGMGVAVPVTSLSGIITAAQHGAQTDTTLHALATAGLHGFMDSADKSKIDGVEAGATADQSDVEIKTAYENNADTNEFSDAEQTKLGAIEAGAEVNSTTLADLNTDITDATLVDTGDIQLNSEKDAASGYAGLDGSSKLAISQMQKVIALDDLTVVDSPLSPSTNDALVWDGAKWVAQPATATNSDTVDSIHANATPTASTLTPLDSNANIQASLMLAFSDAKKNLDVKNNVATPASQVDVDADFLVVEGVPILAINLTADITASGANGLDTGSEAASSWYAVHVITDDTGTINASLLSLSATAPTLPGSYTKSRRVGWMRNDGSSDFLVIYSRGDWNYYDENDNVITAASGVPPASFTNLSVASLVPPTSELAQFAFIVNNSGTGANLFLRPNGGTSTANNGFCRVQWNGVSVSDVLCSGNRECPTDSSQIIDWWGTGSVSSSIEVVGYYDEV